MSRSTRAQLDTPKEKKLELSGWVAALNITLSLGFFIFMYKFLPLLGHQGVASTQPARQSRGLCLDRGRDPALPVPGIYLAHVAVERYSPGLQYHGAEHKTVFAFEAGDPLEPPVVQRWSTFHPRCGTSFLMTVMMISIAVYALVPIRTFWPGSA